MAAQLAVAFKRTCGSLSPSLSPASGLVWFALGCFMLSQFGSACFSLLWFGLIWSGWIRFTFTTSKSTTCAYFVFALAWLHSTSMHYYWLPTLPVFFFFLLNIMVMFLFCFNKKIKSVHLTFLSWLPSTVMKIVISTIRKEVNHFAGLINSPIIIKSPTSLLDN